MCGICGILDFGVRPITRELLRGMCDSFPYRGPDAEGSYVSTPGGLGHRGLRVLDLPPAGHQPMGNEDGTLWIVFNGEIYDYEELRKGLLAAGHRLNSRTDTETLLPLYEEEGFGALKFLNGVVA